MATNFTSNLRIAPSSDEGLTSDKVEPDTIARPIVSSLDTWDFATQIDYANNTSSIGKRQGWNIPSIGVTAETVNTVRSSAFTQFTSPATPQQPRRAFNPTTMSGAYKAVPNMSQNLFVDAEVQINFSILIGTPSNSSPSFAVFRDGKKISQEYRQNTVAGQQSMVSGSYVDTGAQLRKYHVYDLRWKAMGGVPVTAFTVNRTFQASNLRAV